MAKYDKVLLFSGGVDSFIAYHYLEKPQTVYFNLRGRYSLREMKVVKELIPSTIIDGSLHLGDREKGEKAYIPFRNLLMAAQAVKYSDNVVIVGLQDDVVSDKNEGIFDRFSRLLSDMECREIRLTSPFWATTKSQIVHWYLMIYGNGTREKLKKTISCYRAGALDGRIDYRYCGACPACFRKWVAFGVNGIELPFHNRELANEYYERASHGYYISSRNHNIIKMVGRLEKEYDSA
jgi:7-cyano-7-deazaguanine synthase in queuosine biosynthesis